MSESPHEPSQRIVEKLAQRIHGWGLSTQAAVMLELVKPFSFIASQGLLMCQPVLSFLTPGSGI